MVVGESTPIFTIMKFVIDTNIVFSAILNSEGKNGSLIMTSHEIFEFYACEKLRDELTKHHDKLLELSKLSEDQLNQSIYQITNSIIFIEESIIPFEIWLKAANLVRDTDMNDIAFVALSEFLGIKLWTGDRLLMKGLAKKGYTNFITTNELYNLRSLLE
jgi:predicted nucleic acid-binding protein